MKATVAHIFRNSFEAFLASSPRQPQLHYRIAHAITSCRTPILGGHTERCDHCDTQLVRYHSCRNRHCPRCQTSARLNWINDRLGETLPVPYFHVVFTIPAQLNAFALRNKKPFYDLMFRAVKETILELSANPKHLGADMGFIAVLHTWGQTLVDHPHIHCIVPGGGYDTRRERWKAVKGDFLFPIPVVSKLFRGKLMAFFTEALRSGAIKLHGQLQRYEDEQTCRGLVDRLYRTDWLVYIKEPFASTQQLVAYLGAYTHRVAITDSRIERFEDGTVTFRYKDYADHSRIKSMSLAATEFIRRFMLHVLPEGYKRIRYFGFLAPRARLKRLNRCRAFFKLAPYKPKKEVRPWYEIVKELTGKDPLRCLACGIGRLRCIAALPPLPPNLVRLSSG